MIKISGSTNTREYNAAIGLKKIILASLPQLENSQSNWITLISGATCHGQRYRDIDLVLLAQFDEPVNFKPFMGFTNPFDESRLIKPDNVIVDNLCVVIEVKDHSPNHVQFEGTTALVRYQDHWHNASHQSEQQLYSLKNYLAQHNIDSPFIRNVIWFRNLENVDLPKRPHNLLAGNFTWSMFLNVLAQISPPKKSTEWTLTANHALLNQHSVEAIKTLLTKKLQPTQLDRRRLEQINQQVIENQQLTDTIGEQMLILRGRGGTGKTIRLLQLAKFLYEREGARVLILTYNKALVADLQRLLTIMGVVDMVAQRSIRVQTVHSFFYAILREIGFVSVQQNNFLEGYTSFKNEALQWFTEDLIKHDDVEKIKANHYSDFLWDYIFIDEAQDWPEDEQMLLLQLFATKNFVVADGIDQLIRDVTPATWKRNYPTNTKFLQTCLRMKANLTRLVATLANQLGLPQSEWQANNKVTGGRVIVLIGNDKIRERDFFEQLIEQNKEAGNSPIDMLFCVPPKLAVRDETVWTPATQFQAWGWPVWDGTQSTVRDSYPTELEQLRIVQYDSCRGLEGWIVVNFALDKFYDYKFNQLMANQATDADAIRLQTIRWLLIPLTRAMDTLVIHLTNQDSEIKLALQEVANQHRDIVEWYE